jgi:uncharacterized membrane protein YhaH (DUF805 family)
MGQMSPVEWAKRPLKKFADPRGRAPRAEYWWFTLFGSIAYIVAVVIDSVLGLGDPVDSFGLLSGLLALALLIPSIMVGIRRLHDTGRSGWWMLIMVLPLIGLILIVFFCLRGDKGSNHYGADPYGPDSPQQAFA